MKNMLTSSRRSGYLLSSLTIITLLSVSACSNQQPISMDEPPQSSRDKRPQVVQNLPELELSGKLMFDILVAEFAEQSGDLSLANNKYLRSAFTTRDPRLAKKATQAAIFAKQYGNALAGSQLWVELEPDSLDARQSTAALLLLQSRLDEAKPHLIWLLDQDNYSAKRLVAVANLLVRSTNDTGLIALFEEITQTTDKSDERATDVLYATAVLAQKKGKIEIALNRLEQLLNLNPQHVDGVLLRSKLWYTHNRKADAIESLASYLQDNPENLSVRLNYARMLVDTRALTEGLVQFGELVKLAPQNGDIIYGYGILAIQNNLLDIAEQQFLNLIQLKLREAEARQSMGLIFELRNQTDEALSWYSSVPKGEHFFPSQLRAAQLISKRDGIQSAQKFLHQIPAANRAEELQKLVTEAELFEGNQQYDEAFKLFTIALKEAPDNADLLYAHAMAAEKINRIDILEQSLSKVLKADPDNIQALNALGYTLIDRTSRTTEAFAYIKRAYALDPKDPAILDSMGWALYRMGRHQEALEYLRQAHKQLQDGEIYAHLGEVLWVSGDTDGARTVWDDALKFAPNHPVLKSTLERFLP